MGQVCIAVRDTFGTDAKNPLPFHAVRALIQSAPWQYCGRILVVELPNITNVFCGRDVGYTAERLVLDEESERISAPSIRREFAAPTK